MKKMDRKPAPLTQLAENLETSPALGRWAGKLREPVQGAFASDGVRDALQGRALGHALHPVVVQLPIGSLTSALVLDVLGGGASHRESRQLVALALLSAAPAAVTGWAEWADADDRTQRVGVAHAALNGVASLATLASLVARARGGQRAGVFWSAVAATGFSVSAYLGGHMSLVRKYATHDRPSDQAGAGHGVR